MSTTAQLSRVDLPVVGTMLPNHSMVIDVHRDIRQQLLGDYRPQGTVLALISSDHPKPWHEYATWVWVSDERGIVTVHGRYFGSLTKAVADFEDRKKG